ncbi:MAG: response regulator [Rhodobiaceae bacterium]|nr:response regulator [Rhodobiaceae bacterium]MCC0053120.1 response regulator [Rhodobiaceae bacterium]
MSTILCVEDEPQIRADLAEELADAGYEVLEASNGAEGIRMIVERKPDLVISDISMPGMSGYELLTELRRDHPGLAEMPFLFLSAFNERETVIEGIRLGADDFLTKPIDYEMLLTKVEAELRQASRIVREKDLERTELYNALTRGGLENDIEFRWPAMEPRKIILVGRSDKGMWQVQRFLEDLGHEVRVFTSGRAYLQRAGFEELDADITLLWLHSDDMQAPMFNQFRGTRHGITVLVIPPEMGIPAGKLKIKNMDDSCMLPMEEADFYEKLETWVEMAAQKAAERAEQQAAELQAAEA